MRFAAILLAAFVALTSPAYTWGFEAHKFIADRMIALLPAELKPLFEKRRAFIVERAIDPDLWRNVGWEEEPPITSSISISKGTARIRSPGYRASTMRRFKNSARP